MKDDLKSALEIVYTPALTELILVLIAISFNMQIENFINMNIWLQNTIVILLLSVGIILFLGQKECVKDENEECIIIKKRFKMSKQVLGIILGLVNLTVLIYWILIISFLNKKMIYLNIKKVCKFNEKVKLPNYFFTKRTLVAIGPLGLFSMLKVTLFLSFIRSIRLLACTKISSSESLRVIKPNPFLVLKNLTVPSLVPLGFEFPNNLFINFLNINSIFNILMQS